MEQNFVKQQLVEVCEGWCAKQQEQDEGVPMGMLKTRSSLWVRHLAAQQGGYCRFTVSPEEERSASRMVENWFRGNGKM